MPGGRHSLDGCPPQLLCDLAILWVHVLFVNRYKVAAPAALLKGKLEQIRDHGGKYEHTAYQNAVRVMAKIMPSDMLLMVDAYFSHACQALLQLDFLNTYLSSLFPTWSECLLALQKSARNLAADVDVHWLVREGAPGESGSAQFRPLNEEDQRCHRHLPCGGL